MSNLPSSSRINMNLKEKAHLRSCGTQMGEVGMTGFEPATPSSRTTCATGLRYIPIIFNYKFTYFSIFLYMLGKLRPARRTACPPEVLKACYHGCRRALHPELKIVIIKKSSSSFLLDLSFKYNSFFPGLKIFLKY